jgi:putative peptide zinc metalloprotease protein
MEESFYSPSWYRVADLKPRLIHHARIHRQHFRGQLWYVLQDFASGRYHRFSPAAYLVISLMNGERTVRQIWEMACRRLGDDSLTQHELMRLMGQLHQSDVLHGDVPPDVGEMSDRAAKMRRRKLFMSFLNPLAMRLPLFDPDRLLTALRPLFPPIFSWFGALVVFGFIAYALVIAASHWAELTDNIVDRVLVAKSLALLLLTYPFVKALHELGHACAVKRWGGEVHEIGIMFLVFMPVPYVDASSASAFRETWRRALVGAAGIIVELLLASIALFVWLDAAPGLVRAFAFNVMLIGGISTVVFNGNPLLRFDGYYILSDVLEIPNLADRAKRYLTYLITRYPFGVKDMPSPSSAPGEAAWLVVFGVASFCYRLFVVAIIVLLVATKFFVIGVLLAIWSGIMMIGVPLAKGLWFLVQSPVLFRRRRRALTICAACLAVAVGALLLVPVPYRTVAEGIVWAPEQSSVFAGTDGTAVRLLARPDAMVAKGEPLLALRDELLAAQVRVLAAAVEELELRRNAVYSTDPVQERLAAEQLRRAKGELALAQEQQRELVVRSPDNGRFILRKPEDIVGRFVHKGELLGFVASPDRHVALVVVPEDEADLVRSRTRSVELRLAAEPAVSHSARILRQVPDINNRLPSPALSTAGGGQFVMDPRDPKADRVLSKVFHLEVQFSGGPAGEDVGGRVYVRFDHGDEPLAWRFYRDLRQLLLRRLDV